MCRKWIKLELVDHDQNNGIPYKKQLEAQVDEDLEEEKDKCEKTSTMTVSEKRPASTDRFLSGEDTQRTLAG